MMSVYNAHKDGSLTIEVYANKLMTSVEHGMILEHAFHVITVLLWDRVNVCFLLTIKLQRILCVKPGMEVFVLSAPSELFSTQVLFVRKSIQIVTLGINLTEDVFAAILDFNWRMVTVLSQRIQLIGWTLTAVPLIGRKKYVCNALRGALRINKAGVHRFLLYAKLTINWLVYPATLATILVMDSVS